MTQSFSWRTLAAGLALALTLLFVPSISQAKSPDRDRDGLTAKQEKRYRTNPRKADTDSDGLKDGAEVKKYRTNPRRSDTDSDGIRDDRELKAKSNPRSKDSDADGIDDLHEHGTYGDAEEVKGTITGIEGASVTIRAQDGTETQVSVDSATRLRAPDSDGDGQVTLADFKVGDLVESHVEATDAGNHALSLKLEDPDDDQGEEQDGYGPDNPEHSPGHDDGSDPAESPEESEVKGRIGEIGTDSVTLTRRDGTQVKLTISPQTRLRAPDRDGSGFITLADFRVGDRVEAKTSADLSTTFELKVD